jgi:hypothetical protein
VSAISGIDGRGGRLLLQLRLQPVASVLAVLPNVQTCTVAAAVLSLCGLVLPRVALQAEAEACTCSLLSDRYWKQKEPIVCRVAYALTQNLRVINQVATGLAFSRRQQ